MSSRPSRFFRSIGCAFGKWKRKCSFNSIKIADASSCVNPIDPKPTEIISRSVSTNDLSSKVGNVVQQIKAIGKKYANRDITFDTQTLETDVSTVTSTMQQFQNHKHIQRFCAHALSNMAIHQQHCSILCHYNAHQFLIVAVKQHFDDWKLCWYTYFLLQFDKPVVNLLYQVIEHYHEVHLVIETTLGALSNLVLSETLRNSCGSADILQNIIKVIDRHKHHSTIATVSAGLFTNLGHNDNIAFLLTESGAVELTIAAMKIHKEDICLQRNCCAALSNMATSASYLERLVNCFGVEMIMGAVGFRDAQTEALAEQALSVADPHCIEANMSSLHVASRKGLYQSVYNILKQGMQINLQDAYGNTPLHYAIEHQHERITQLLVTRGALLHLQNKVMIFKAIKRDLFFLFTGKSALKWLQEKKPEEEKRLAQAINQGVKELKVARLQMAKLIYDVQQQVPLEVAQEIVAFSDAMEIVEFFGENDEQKAKWFLCSVSNFIKRQKTDKKKGMIFEICMVCWLVLFGSFLIYICDFFLSCNDPLKEVKQKTNHNFLRNYKKVFDLKNPWELEINTNIFSLFLLLKYESDKKLKGNSKQSTLEEEKKEKGTECKTFNKKKNNRYDNNGFDNANGDMMVCYGDIFVDPNTKSSN
ncbi:26S proteasome non-ATPase regulatory subunit 10 [Reticulomyxa filosa]|uniref:26S proteasome non-ATPase regulatory subunit 10 n=1 Tax=Reticulomyxa filosa TaxID=46433 RepID=X6PCH4_RETFI|nr:26S proteasome non-ATPase regulatory subunit 10 [Reticulomyxa filosa]|eukprot:ETO36235.1 26S proteasome non-ATPase regulatory subunit 10 [Reticulomyxa filosa]